MTLTRALHYLFGEIRSRYGRPDKSFLGKIKNRFPEYSELLNVAQQRGRLKGRLKRAPQSLEEVPVLRILLDKDRFDELYRELCKFFDADDHEELKRLLRGESIDRKIIFLSNQNRLVEVFRRLKYNGFLFETWTEVRNWLCHSFMYLSKNGAQKLNRHSVWDILSKAKGEPSPKSRICKFEWLEYKTSGASFK